MKFIKSILCKLAKVMITKEQCDKCHIGTIEDNEKKCPYKCEVESDE
jgi:hypothetical protein